MWVGVFEVVLVYVGVVFLGDLMFVECQEVVDVMCWDVCVGDLQSLFGVMLFNEVWGLSDVECMVFFQVYGEFVGLNGKVVVKNLLDQYMVCFKILLMVVQWVVVEMFGVFIVVQVCVQY